MNYKNGVFFMILIMKPLSHIVKVPNLPKRDKNQSGSARQQPKDEHDETKL